MRSAIGFLLLGALAIGGCDRQSQAPQQANETTAAANASVGSEPEYGGTLDRTHKGEAAPATEFTDPSGKKVSIASFKGKPVLLNLWATWCIPCIKEMPTLDTLAGANGDSLQILTVSQDLKGKESVDPFFTKAGYKHLKPYLDTEAALSTGMGANLPTTILYDSAGREVWRMSGDYDWSGEKAAALIAEAK
ncbi:TlpA disulfide reductase family protein [Sphingomonas sp. JC676]|uniref:TlpA family protein disulfide reductase n=1 Tax=Sphingomonas sp. JC676 TaxID=2768065 RepID=UPI00292A588C|nr:TlpA disulfide reductase family protein [Sphingomonas sp. JC676]